MAGCDTGSGPGPEDPTPTPTPTVDSVTVSAAGYAPKGSTLQFSALVSGTNSPSQTVTWSIETEGKHADTGIDESGLLTVAGAESVTSLTIKAVSTQDTSKSGTKTVQVKASSTGTIFQVKIDGVTAVGQTLTATALDSSQQIVTDATWQWKRGSTNASLDDFTNIDGATNQAYTLTSADQGCFIRVVADNAVTTDPGRYSDATPKIAAAGSTPKTITITGAETLNGRVISFYVYGGDGLPIAGSMASISGGSADVALTDSDSAWTGSGSYFLSIFLFPQPGSVGTYYGYTNGAVFNRENLASYMFTISEANHSIPWNKFVSCPNPAELFN
jgi:hypothetical protein